MCMEITKYLYESLNESVNSKAMTKKLSKYLTKENLAIDKNGFGGFGVDSRPMFAMVFEKIVENVFIEINYDEIWKLNSKFAKSSITKISDTKVKKYLDKVLLTDDRILPISKRIATLVKWDMLIFVETMNDFFTEQGFRDMNLKNGIEENKKQNNII